MPTATTPDATHAKNDTLALRLAKFAARESLLSNGEMADLLGIEIL